MSYQIQVKVKCPMCRKSMMNSDVPIDSLPSIDLLAKVGEKKGHVYLSQIYGSFNKIFEGVDDIPDSIVECGCPHCNLKLPQHKRCECGAPISYVGLEMGGAVNFCTRNGCRHHSMEFENVNDAFTLFNNADESRYA